MRNRASHPRLATYWKRRTMAPIGVVALSLMLLLVTGCNSTSGTSTGGTQSAGNATATATGAASGTATTAPSANATCASALPGAGTINLTSTLEYPTIFPNGTVGTSPTQTASGTGLFTVYEFSACSPNTSVSGVNSFFASNLGALPHGWINWKQFPADGGLMSACNAACWYDPKGSAFDYLVFDQFTDQGNGVITYRARYALSPDFPNCNSNFNNPPASQVNFFLQGYSPALPLPPLSSTAPDDASGGQKGFDICSPGDATSVTTFMEKELAATGWTKSSTGTSQDSCIFSGECWVNGARAISFNVPGDATSWIIAWRQAV
ncbi:MAG TPA: hypothetical protein VMV29_14900 [Ktedonobacterales bacterium]|nr:hypothetical protein [Ktedonobacterales bacterium]